MLSETIVLNLNSVRLNEISPTSSSSISKTESLREKHVEKINRSLNRWVSNESTNTRIWQKLALLSSWQGHIEEATWQWANTDETVNDLIIRGLHASITQNSPKSHPLNPNVWFEIGIATNPEVRDLWFYQGIYYWKQNQPQSAINALQNGIRAPDSYKVSLGEVYYQLALVYRGEARFDDALDMIEEALMVRDNLQVRINSYYLQGEILLQLGRNVAAMEAYTAVTSLQPNHYWALTRIGLLTWKIDGDQNQAIQLLENIISINSEYKLAYQALGGIYCETGQTEKAVAAYRDVLLRDPKDSVALQITNDSTCY